MKFRKKPVIVEAVRFALDEMTAFEAWLDERGGADKCSYEGQKLFIHTLEGEMEARPGDWIIQGVRGELYPCKPEIFAATYEAVGDMVSNKDGLTFRELMIGNRDTALVEDIEAHVSMETQDQSEAGWERRSK
jgi:hypothetical protein